MKRHLDRIRTRPEQLRNLARSEIGPVAERDQLAVTLIERVDRARDSQAPDRLRLEIAGRRLVHSFARQLEPRPAAVDAALRDPEQPGDRLAFLRVVALPVAER